MVIANDQANNVRCNQADKVNQTDIGHDHRGQQAAKYHVGKCKPFYVNSQTDGCFLAAQQRVIIPAAQEEADRDANKHDQHFPNVAPARVAKTAERPEHQRIELNFICEILHQRRCTGKHGADRRTCKDNSLCRNLTKSTQAQNNQCNCHAANERAQRNCNAAKVSYCAHVQHDNCKRRAKASAL